MFGVNEKGQDTLINQFRKGPGGSGKKLVPGGAIDHGIRLSLEKDRLARSEKVRSVLLDDVLQKVAAEERIMIPASLFREAREEEIARTVERRETVKRQIDAARETMISALAPDIRGTYETTATEQAVRQYETEREKERFFREISMDHPDVIKRAFKKAWEGGLFRGHEEMVRQKLDTRIEEMALHNSHQAAAAEIISASRNAILSIQTE